MKNTELRIGNWVSLKGCHKQVVWVKYSKVCVMNGYPSSIVDLEDVKPIPLTEEILLKCGLLLYDELDGEYRINETRYSIHKVTNFDGFLFCDGNNVLSDIKYLHQLQNLYHALTGQELKIEL